jgi:hypothetical protein
LARSFNDVARRRAKLIRCFSSSLTGQLWLLSGLSFGSIRKQQGDPLPPPLHTLPWVIVKVGGKTLQAPPAPVACHVPWTIPSSPGAFGRPLVPADANSIAAGQVVQGSAGRSRTQGVSRPFAGSRLRAASLAISEVAPRARGRLIRSGEQFGQSRKRLTAEGSYRSG